MPTRTTRNIIVLTCGRACSRSAEQMRPLLCSCSIAALLFAVLAFAACTKPDRNDEATALSDELLNVTIDNMDKALERVDSAEKAGVFTSARANTLKAMIYEYANRRQMATYYAEKAIAAEKGQDLTADSSLWCMLLGIQANVAYANGEYGKSLALSKEILAFIGDGTSPQNMAAKCRDLSQMADCESELGHVDEAERLYLQSIDIMMESTQHATRVADIDPLIFSLLSLNDLYLDNKMPERALPLMAIMDSAMNRLIRCLDEANWVVQMRRNNVTISKAMVYAANNQKDKAEALFQEHRLLQGLNTSDKTAEGVYLSIMGRYDEAIRMFDEVDSIRRTSGEPITNIYIKTLLMHKYEALKKAGRTAEALAMGDRMRQLTDSIRQQERLADVEQLQEIKQQEEEIIQKHQSLMTQRVVGLVIVIILLTLFFIIYTLVRRRAAKRLAEVRAAQERIENELKIARDIQMSMVPSTFPEREGLDMYASMTPAREVGGDLYGYLLEGDKLYFALGDVSGKGVPASLFMAQATRLFLTLAKQGMMPAEICTRMNDALSGNDNESGMFVTFFLGLVDLTTGHLDFCNAGHNPPVIGGGENHGDFLDMLPNAPIGLWPGLEYEGEEMDSIKGRPLFIYTDGLNEAENTAQEQFGDDRLLAILRNTHFDNARQVIESLQAEVEHHRNGAEPNDDLTMMCLRMG